MDLFAALDYVGLENRTSVLLLAVLRHLGDEARSGLLRDVVPSPHGPTDEIFPQHTISEGVLDGYMRWSGRCVVALEAKVNSILGHEQPNRYARWLSRQPEPARVLWLITRGASDVDAVLSELNIPANVTLARSTWTELAERAVDLARRATEVDHLLLMALACRLRDSGVAGEAGPIEPVALGLALGTLHHVDTFRERLLQWLNGMHWLPGEWERKDRSPNWVPVSVCAKRDLHLARPDLRGCDLTWFIEIYAPAEVASSRSGAPLWPPGQKRGAQLRIGVHFYGKVIAEALLEPLRAALGAPCAAGHPDYAAAEPRFPWTYDDRQYHEIWWMVNFDPTELVAVERELRTAMAEQIQRLAPFISGGLGALRIE